LNIAIRKVQSPVAEFAEFAEFAVEVEFAGLTREWGGHSARPIQSVSLSSRPTLSALRRRLHYRFLYGLGVGVEDAVDHHYIVVGL